MILIDTSVLVYKNLFSAIKYSTDKDNRPIKKHNKKYKTEDFKALFIHKFLNDLRYIYAANKNKYSEMVLCLDDHSTSNWKKSFYPEYKAQRKKSRDEGEVDFKEFFKLVDELLQEVREAFHFKVISIPKCEADEIIAVLTEKYHSTKQILIVSVDKDFNQLFKYKNVKIYNPIKLKHVKPFTQKELLEWKTEHIFLGDSADNIPKVVSDTEFSPEFIKFLNKNDIYVTDVYSFKQLNISNKLISDFMEISDKPIYKKTRFGPKALSKFLENFEDNMKLNPLYWENYKRNEKLVLFEYIPDDLKNDIVTTFNNLENNYDIGRIMQFFMKNKLIELYSSYQDFLLPVKSSLESDINSNPLEVTSKPNSDLKESTTGVLESIDIW